MKDSTLLLPYPDHYIKNPSVNEIKDILNKSQYSGDDRIGSLYLDIVDSEKKGFYQKLTIHIHNSKEVLLIFDSSELDDWIITIGDLNRNTTFKVEDVGGVDWKLNERYLITIEQGVKYAIGLLNGSRIEAMGEWEQMPEDFLSLD